MGWHVAAWSEQLAKNGYNAYQILQYFYKGVQFAESTKIITSNLKGCWDTRVFQDFILP